VCCCICMSSLTGFASQAQAKAPLEAAASQQPRQTSTNQQVLAPPPHTHTHTHTPPAHLPCTCPQPIITTHPCISILPLHHWQPHGSRVHSYYPLNINSLPHPPALPCTPTPPPPQLSKPQLTHVSPISPSITGSCTKPASTAAVSLSAYACRVEVDTLAACGHWRRTRFITADTSRLS
jgi:hypothetical protein